LRRSGRVVAWGAGVAAAGLVSAGQHPDTQSGKQLFINGENGKQACGTCHTLSDAGTSGTIGPNLDNAFAIDRMQGYADSSIENVVLDQIRLGSGPIATYTTNAKFTPQTPMPKNLVTGQDAIDVAAYVASVAGISGITSSASFASFGTNGMAIFKGAGCAGCHTLAAAGSTGTVGPNLDQLKPAMAIVVHQVTNGGVTMPAFKGKLSAAQIQAVAKYVSSSAGKK
jgi:mono/diheme cytochrome c family protein